MLRRLVAMNPLALVVLLTGCDQKTAPAPTSAPAVEMTPVEAGPRYLALGDSYTIGTAIEPRESYPQRLVASLRERGLTLNKPTVIAANGWTTADLLTAIERAGPKPPFVLVTLLIGVNNQYLGLSVDEYRQQFHDLLGRAIGFAGGQAGHVIVLSIPDWSVTPRGKSRDVAKTAAEIDRFNEACREETAAAKARFLDITPLSREAAGDATLVAADQLHFAGKMHIRWVERLLPVAEEVLKDVR